MSNKDYVTPTSGSLRLKGIGPSSKISKIHKRKKKRENTGEEKGAIRREATHQDGLRRHDLDVENVDRSKDRNKGQKQAMDGPTDEKPNAAEEDDEDRLGGHKTEAELRYEERRRKRLDERLRREGIKTHKERVEDLNRYLSGLSEHHDMPRIGPG